MKFLTTCALTLVSALGLNLEATTSPSAADSELGLAQVFANVPHLGETDASDWNVNPTLLSQVDSFSQYEGGMSAVVISVEDDRIIAGFAGDDAPRTAFPNVVGHPKSKGQDVLVGDEAMAMRGMVNLSYPVQHGIVTNWDDFEMVLQHTFYNELRMLPEETAVIISESPSNSSESREKLTHILFETFNVPALYIMMDAAASLLASERTTGLVLQSGSGVTHAVPVFEGYPLYDAILREDIGGRDVTKLMVKLLSERGYSFTTAYELHVVEDIVQKLGFVALDFDQEMADADGSHDLEGDYELPDGNVITLGNERFRALELLFQPGRYGFDNESIQDMVYSSIMKCEVEVQKDLFRNIVLAGTNTNLPGMADRMTDEIDALAPKTIQVKVDAKDEREYSSWIGMSIMGSLSTFDSMLVNQEEYNEVGPSIINKKRF